MTLATWLGVKTELLADTNRAGDAAFALRLPAFLERAMQRIHHGGAGILASSPIRIRANRLSADVVLTNGAGPLPDGYLEADRVYLPTEPATSPTYVEPWQFHRDRSTATTGYPCRYTIEGGQILTDPPLATGTLTLLYYAKFATPSADADTNWLMANAPSVLIDALRVEAYQYLRNTEMVQTSFASYQSAVEALMRSEIKAKTSGGPLYPRLRRAT